MKVAELIRENIKNLKPFRSAREEFAGLADIHLDANENPFDSEFNRYPDPFQTALRAAAARYYGIDESQIIIGNGSDEIIDWLIRGFCEPKTDSVRILTPSFGMYRVLAELNDVMVEEVPLGEQFELDVKMCLGKSDRTVKLIFLCSPNNPTGNSLSRKKMLEVIDKFPGLVIVDEAYIEFACQESLLDKLPEYENLVVLRTFSKEKGGAGLRVGICFAHSEVINVLMKIKLPYNVGTHSQKMAIDLLKEKEMRELQVKDILSQRERLERILPSFEFVEHVFPSDANFLLVRFKQARRLYDYLIGKKIIIRDRSSLPGCEGCLRITVGTSEQNDALVEALRAYSP